MEMFDKMADEVFEKAGVVKNDKTSFLWEQCRRILETKMASCSLIGLSMERVEVFNKQKDTLVEDLKKFKIEGKI